MSSTGSDTFLNHVWKNYGKRIRFFIYQVLPADTSEHDDIFQEVMLKVHSSRELFDRKYSLDTWLYRITRNHCIDYLRKRKPNEDSSFDIEKCGVSGPYEAVIRSELSQQIHDALASLDTDDRQIAFLRFCEAFNIRTISVIMDMNINSVKTRLTKIKRELKSRLKDKL